MLAMLAFISFRWQENNAIFVSIVSKKDTTIGVRVDDELYDIIQTLAEKDDRPVASMARKLIVEALEKRKILKKSNIKSLDTMRLARLKFGDSLVFDIHRRMYQF